MIVMSHPRTSIAENPVQYREPQAPRYSATPDPEEQKPSSTSTSAPGSEPDENDGRNSEHARPLIERVADLMGKKYGFGEDGAMLATLAIQAMALGPACRTVFPSSGTTVVPGLNLLLCGGNLGCGFDDLSACFWQMIGGCIEQYRDWGLVRKRTELAVFREKILRHDNSLRENEERIRLLKSTDPAVRVPGRSPCGYEDLVLEENIQQERQQRGQVLLDLGRVELSLRSVMVTSEFVPATVNGWGTHLFDAGLGVVNSGPAGLRSLLDLPSKQARRLLPFINSAIQHGNATTFQSEFRPARLQFAFGCEPMTVRSWSSGLATSRICFHSASSGPPLFSAVIPVPWSAC